MTRQQRIFLLTGISIAVAAALFFLPAIAQDPGYHNLSDRRMIAGIPNFGDVVSNAAFLVVGLLGLWQLFQVREDRSRLAHPQEALPLAIAFGGTILIFAGSGYYHWAPDNETLLWDRLPMTFAFMGVFTMILVERISVKAGRVGLLPLLVVGVASVLYWHFSEQAGRGDLRPYALVQFLPIVLIPLLLWLFPPRYTGACYIVEMIGWYLLAKVLEFLDANIWGWTAEGVSGHTLKHLAAAGAIYALVRYLKYRRRVPAGGESAG